MDTVELPRLIYLIILLVAVGGWFFAENRLSLGKNMRYAAVWGLIFLGAIAAAGLWQDIRGDLGYARSEYSGNQISLTRGFDGHFNATLNVNGVPVNFTVDTGATDIVLSPSDAYRAGIDADSLSFVGIAQTANGTTSLARVRLEELRLGTISDQNVVAYVNQSEMGMSLLGMAYLNRFSSIEIQGRQMVLTR